MFKEHLACVSSGLVRGELKQRRHGPLHALRSSQSGELGERVHTLFSKAVEGPGTSELFRSFSKTQVPEVHPGDFLFIRSGVGCGTLWDSKPSRWLTFREGCELWLEHVHLGTWCGHLWVAGLHGQTSHFVWPVVCTCTLKKKVSFQSLIIRRYLIKFWISSLWKILITCCDTWPFGWAYIVQFYATPRTSLL